MPRTPSIHDPSPSHKSQVRSGDAVIFFPTAAWLSDRTWRIPIHGWIYTPAQQSRTRRVALRLLKHILRRRIPADHPGMPLFDQRASAFLANNHRNARILVRIGEEIFRLKRSRPDGHFRGALKIPPALFSPAGEPHAPRWLDFLSVSPECTPEPCAGRVLLVPPVGLSVISDIDDTLKITEVAHRRSMLSNTFLRHFSSVPDMAALYRYWQTEHHAAFHYVSASPWHLYPFLSDFLREKNFPDGTFHLRDFRLVPGHIAKSVRPARRVKSSHIRDLLLRFPDRRFILVGDSGETDPETYGRFCRRHPHQIHRICIRNITGEPPDHGRWEKAFSDIPTDRWQLFDYPSELL